MDITTPCYIIDMDRLKLNLSRITKFRRQADCKVLLALKGFSMPYIIPYILKSIDGLSASGAYEARLGKEFHTFVSTFAPAYPLETFQMVIDNSNILVFNSSMQFYKYSPIAKESGISCGIRINPEYSELPESFGANPCCRFSHLGIRQESMPAIADFEDGTIDGIHLHTMCAQNADTLARVIDNLIEQYDMFLRRISWLNLGGGQLYCADDYDMDLAIKSIKKLHERYQFQIIVEPCEGILTQCGYLAARVMDITYNEVEVAILDSSAVCHLSDAVYRDWSRDVVGGGEPGDYKYNVRLAGCSCYAGDIFGNYSFPQRLHIGDYVFFRDAAIYSAVKASMFNGIPLPGTAIYSKKNGLKMINQFNYETFRQTL